MPGEEQITKVLDANGEWHQGGIPGQMSELDVTKEGGHVTGHTDHSRPKREGQTTGRPAPNSKAMDLNQIIGRTAGTKAGTAKGGKAATAEPDVKAGKQTSPRARRPKATKVGTDGEVPAPAPAPEAPPKHPLDADGHVATKDAMEAYDKKLPYLTIEYNGMQLHFTQGDITTARAMPDSELGDADRAMLSYADKVEAEQRAEAARREQIDAEAAAAKAKTDAEAAPPKEQSDTGAGPQVGAEDESRGSGTGSNISAAAAETEVPPAFQSAQAIAEEINRAAVGSADFQQPVEQSSVIVQGHDEAAPQSSSDSHRPTRRLDLSGSAPVSLSVSEQVAGSAAETWAQEHGPASIERVPLKRVSVQDICAACSASLNDLRAAIGPAAPMSFVTITAEEEDHSIFVYCISRVGEDRTYLLGMGPNIAYGRIRSSVLSDCNNRFGIDGTCAWVDEMTWVIRRTDL